MTENYDNPSRFVEASTKLATEASRLNVDALVLIGGNAEESDVRQKEIFDVVNNLHRAGQQSYWYKSKHNANLDIPDQVVPGQTYVVVNLDVMTISEVVSN